MKAAGDKEVQQGFGRVICKDMLLFPLIIQNTLYLYIDAGIIYLHRHLFIYIN